MPQASVVAVVPTVAAPPGVRKSDFTYTHTYSRTLYFCFPFVKRDTPTKQNLKGKKAPHDDVAYGQARTFLISQGGTSVAITFPTSKLAKTTPLCPPTTNNNYRLTKTSQHRKRLLQLLFRFWEAHTIEACR